MIITFSPAGEPSHRFEWTPDEVRSDEAELMELKFGDTWDTFNQLLLKGSMRARRVLLWHLQRRDHPTLKFEDVSFPAGSVHLEFNVDEYQKLRKGAETAAGITDEQREQALKMIDAEIAKAEAGKGKASSESSATSTA